MSVKNSEALKTIVLDGVKYVEVREEAVVSDSQPKFKVGDLAKLKYSERGFEGEIVRITEVNPGQGFDYRNTLLRGDVGLLPHQAYATHEDQLEPYTPQAGDVLTVDGVEYRLVERKAEVGEKVIVVDNTGGHNAHDFEICTCEIVEEGDSVRMNRPVTWMKSSEYIVLQPTANETKPQSINVTITITNEGSVEEIAKRLISELKRAVR